jgi:putative ABC transport system permease protein
MLLGNYIKVAFRNILRYKGYAFINVAGLAIGMACCILIMVWVQYQFSYDRFHKNIDDLYWVPVWYTLAGDAQPTPGTPPALGPALKADFPEVTEAARYCGPIEILTGHGDSQFRERISAVEPSFFRMFTFPLVKGDSLTPLSDPNSIVVSEEIAEKYFGGDNPIGQTIVLDSRYQFRVTAVMKTPPPNSTFQPRILVPFSFIAERYGKEYIETWYNCSFYTFAQLREGTNYRAVNDKLLPRIRQSDATTNLEPFLYPFARVHLYSFDRPGGLIGTMMLFSVIAGIILVIASINFVNLMTARSGQRAREVGMRKVVGASRSNLVKQFYLESFFYVVTAGLVAVVLVELLLPFVRSLTGDPVSFDLIGQPILLLGTIAVIVATGILSGLYPALLLSRVLPVKVLKGSSLGRNRRSTLRRGLVIVQFTASMILIVSAMVAFRQYGYLVDKDLGFNKEQMVVLPLNDEVDFDRLKDELLQRPNIQHVTRSTHSPSGIYWNGEGWDWDGKDPAVDPFVTYVGIDNDFLETFQAAMVDGRFFSPTSPSGAANEIIINEAFAEQVGSESVVGRQLCHEGSCFTVIGIIRNFHFWPADRSIGPLVVYFEPTERQWSLFARIDAGDVSVTLQYMKEVWEKHCTSYPFAYHFLDEEFKDMYTGYEGLNNMLFSFSALAIMISGMGLVGLASFTAEQRTKEIGIRKVLGASVCGILRLLSREALMLVLIAAGLAIPVAYLVMNHWLQQFPYRTDLNPWIFIFAAVGLMVIGFVCVAYQALKAATANPVESLKYE